MFNLVVLMSLRFVTLAILLNGYGKSASAETAHRATPQAEELINAADPVWMKARGQLIFHDASDKPWFQFKAAKLTWIDANQYCRNFGLRLPTRTEVEQTKKQLLKEDAKNVPNNPEFWLAAAENAPKNFRYQSASLFAGEQYSYLNIDDLMNNHAELSEVVRCVYDAPAARPPQRRD